MGKILIQPPILNERLKALRKEFGYSYLKLETLTGISHSTLQRYENSSYADIPLNKLSSIAQAYNVSIDYLLGLEDKDLPYNYFESLVPLLEELGISIQYDGYHNRYDIFIKSTSTENTFRTTPITNEELKNLKETTLSYLKFKISELISKPPMVE